jgi:hypothetical protein
VIYYLLELTHLNVWFLNESNIILKLIYIIRAYEWMFFFWFSSLVARNSTFKICLVRMKESGRKENCGTLILCIYNAIVLPIELSSRNIFFLFNEKKNYRNLKTHKLKSFFLIELFRMQKFRIDVLINLFKGSNFLTNFLLISLFFDKF